MKIAGINQQQPQRQTGAARSGERGSATVIALLILGLLTIFVALALSRTTAEALIMGNDAAEARSFYAAQASIETMSRNFNKIYDVRLSPTTGDINNVQNTVPQGFTGYTFNQVLTRTGVDETVVLAGGPFEGLTALRDPWNLDTTATGPSGVQVDLRRTFFSNRIPIFQFGIFYNDDMELSPGAAFAFGGRVHTNGNFYIRGGGTVQFNSRVSASQDIVVDVARNGRANIANPTGSEASAGFGQNIYIKDANATFQQLKVGEASVLGGPDTNSSKPDVPDGSYNPLWSCKSYTPKRYACRPVDDIFDGNLIAHATELNLPLKLGSPTTSEIEIIKQGTASDNQILGISRYYNKPGIRVTLADSQSRLPGGTGGVRLDANYDALGTLNGLGAVLGYKSKPMLGTGLTYKTARFNAYRLYRGASYTTGGMPATRESWIKVEIVNVDANTLTITSSDITVDFLSLGFTEHAPTLVSGTTTLFKLKDWSLLNPTGYDNDPNTGTDSRAILKMQRWAIPGAPVKRTAYADANNITKLKNTSGAYPNAPGNIDATGKPVYQYVGAAPSGYSVLAKNTYYPVSGEDNNKMDATINGDTSEKSAPFPIKMFDSREGIAQETSVQWADLAEDDLSSNGIVSLIDVDVANLRKFLRGDYDGQFPNGLRSTDIPRDRGWLLYVSDRRGDKDNDGEYDMEDVYGPNDNIFQLPEDMNENGALDVDYTWEGARYSDTLKADVAAFFDHKYFRRAVRLVNGTQLPGDKNNGFTLASENGVYIFGNYNATGVATYGSPTPITDYLPAATAATGAPWIVNNTQVPASVVADAVTILSNPFDGNAGWSDGASFGCPLYARETAANPPNLPYDYPGRPAKETTIRTAILQGNTISSILADPNQGGYFSERLNGSVNNFKRFLEEWRATSVPNVNYAGSLINLFHSRQYNGPFKYGAVRVYNAPNRNWVFDDSFLDATRLPPGTPFFQYLQVTGFQRINN
jgi:hypothetical protein